MKTLFLLFCLPFFSVCHAQVTINTMFYNLYRFPEQPPVNRENILKSILDGYRPDLFMVCELISELGADQILYTSLQDLGNGYARAEFIPTLSDIQDPLHQMVFYNKNKLVLVQQHAYPTSIRDINHYIFVLNTLDLNIDSVFLDVFVTHLKSSEGQMNRMLRLGMVDTFIQVLATIPSDHHVLFAGDFNFYSAYDEPAYQKLLDPTNPIVLQDPINRPGNWSNNDSFKDIHTQATRTSADGFGVGGATGGMDDRFDFIMMSQSLQSAANLHLVTDSYHAYGNNGNCFNERVDNYACEGPYSLELRQHLHNMSDHLPIVMQLQSDKQFLSINEQEKPPPFFLSPGNIVSDVLTIHFREPTNLKGVSLTLYNNLGQLLHLITLDGKKHEITINTSMLAAGIYYIRLSDKKPVTLKFLKQ